MTPVWVASIDIGRGFQEPIQAFSDPAAAEAYRAWRERVGDRCYIAEVVVVSEWAEPVIEWMEAA